MLLLFALCTTALLLPATLALFRVVGFLFFFFIFVDDETFSDLRWTVDRGSEVSVHMRWGEERTQAYPSGLLLVLIVLVFFARII